jgi:hypothetical protein
LWKHFEGKLKILRFAPTFLAKPAIIIICARKHNNGIQKPEARRGKLILLRKGLSSI